MTERSNVLGDNLHNILRRRKITQTALGQAVGCSEVFISRIVAGSKKPSVDKLTEIAEYLGVTVNDLIYENGSAGSLHDENKETAERAV